MSSHPREHRPVSAMDWAALALGDHSALRTGAPLRAPVYKIGGEGLEHVMQFLKERERDKSKILPKLNRVRVGKNKLSSEQQQALKELCSELGLKCET